MRRHSSNWVGTFGRSSIVAGCLVASLAVGIGVFDRAFGASRDTVVIAQGTDITTGDPQRTGLTPDLNVLSNIYETLINRDAQLHLHPGLARSWRMIDPTTWEFTLRPGVRFHDGEPFTAQAVKFSIERGLDPRLRWPRARLFAPIRAVTVVNATTVRIETKSPMPPALFLQLIAVNSWIVPPGYLATNGDDALIRHPVGTGPYKFVEWVQDDHVTLAANTDYWGGAPKIAHVIVRAIPNEASRLAELLAGSVDLINLIPPDEFDVVQRDRNAKLVHAISLSMFFMDLNIVNLPAGRPLGDPRVRQALNYAVARKALLTTIMHNDGTPIVTFCTALQFGCDASVPAWSYDPGRAKALLAEAGYAGGFDMTIATTSGVYPGDRDLALAIAAQLNEVGVRARAVIVEYGILLQQVANKKLAYDSTLTRHTSFYGDAGEIAATYTSQAGYTSWSPADPRFEQLLADAAQSADGAKAKALLRQAQLLFREEMPTVPLFTAPNAYGMNRALTWTPRPDLLLLMRDASWN